MDLIQKSTRYSVVSIHVAKDKKSYSTNLFDHEWKTFSDTPTLNRALCAKYYSARKDLAQVDINVNELVNIILSTTSFKCSCTLPISSFNTVAAASAVSVISAPPAPQPAPDTMTTSDAIDKDKENQEKIKLQVSCNLLNFFKEFNFEPAMRFTNTLMNYAKISKAKANRYVLNYMAIRDAYDQPSISKKIQSSEWSQILDDLKSINSDVKINGRLVMFYGVPGSGKSTEAIKAYPNAKVFACLGNMQPDDLFQHFAFNDENGNPIFKPTPIVDAMINGNEIILDEFNLLSDETQTALQSILDNKRKVIINNKEIEIKEGFKIIATFNLMINGQAKHIADAIVDRALEIKQFEMSPELLAKYSF